jgi:hypothetical protein
MCEICDELDRKIGQYRRFVAEPIDTLTKDRLRAGMEELKMQRASMHVESDGGDRDV